jgi:hypothetical protein
MDEWEDSMGELSPVGKFIYNYKDDAIIAAIMAQMDRKPVELLSDYEKLGIVFGVNVPLYENDRVFTTYTDIGIALIDNQYHVFLAPIPERLIVDGNIRL